MNGSSSNIFTNEQLCEISRDAFIDELNQALDTYGENPFDPYGTAARLAIRGEQKSRILEALLRSEVFYKQFHFDKLQGEPGLSRDPKFQPVMDALDSVYDFEPPRNWRKIAIEEVSMYDHRGKISKAIEEGAESTEVLELLKQSSLWIERLHDFETSMDVELPQQAQINEWHEFQKVLTVIQDLDEIELDEADFFRDFFEPVEIIVDDSSVTWRPNSDCLIENYGPMAASISKNLEEYIMTASFPSGSLRVTPTGPNLPATIRNLWTVVWALSQIFDDCEIVLVGPDFPNLDELYGDDDEGRVY